MQLNDPFNTSTTISVAGIHAVKERVDVLIYCMQAIDSTILAALNTIGSQYVTVTHKMVVTVTQLLHYVGTHTEATV